MAYNFKRLISSKKYSILKFVPDIKHIRLRHKIHPVKTILRNYLFWEPYEAQTYTLCILEYRIFCVKACDNLSNNLA
jgi:hypothetical protein